MRIREQEYRRRFEDFPDPIRLLGFHDPRMRRIMELYARAEIVTLQEALCQMILELSEHVAESRAMLLKIYEQSGFIPGTIPITPPG